MKHHDITKLCADSLCAYIKENQGIKLGISHSYELVAAFLGYKSRAALLADTNYPVSNLETVQLILLDPPVSFVEQRLKSLQGAPSGMPSCSTMAEAVYAPLKADKKLSEKIWPTSLRQLAVTLAEERLQDHMGHLRISPAPQWKIGVGMEASDAEITMTVTFDSPLNAEKRLRHSKMEIKLPRIAGNIGYGRPEVMPTFYSGLMRDPEFNPDLGINTGAKI